MNTLIALVVVLIIMNVFLLKKVYKLTKDYNYFLAKVKNVERWEVLLRQRLSTYTSEVKDVHRNFKEFRTNTKKQMQSYRQRLHKLETKNN